MEESTSKPVAFPRISHSSSTLMGTSNQPILRQVTDLNHLFASQESLLLSPTSDPSALKSVYERERIRANLDYTRSLLLTISSSSASRLAKEDITLKRNLIKRLQARLNELDQLYADEDDIECATCDEEEVISSVPNAQRQEPEELRLRNNKSASTSQPPGPTVTSISNRYSGLSPTKEQDASALRESQLVSDLNERDVLSASLLGLASQLKSSARSFATTLGSEKGTLDATILGLDRSVGGMEGAGGKMKELKRETEGAGWWRRMKLYAEVAGLWLFLLLLVFVGPKLRF